MIDRDSNPAGMTAMVATPEGSPVGSSGDRGAGVVTPVEGVRDTAHCLPGVEVGWGDPIDLPVGDEIAGLVIWHVPQWSDTNRHHQDRVDEYGAWLVEVIDEVERVLERGGRLVLIVKGQESRRPFLDLATSLIGPLHESGFTVPIVYTWCTEVVTPRPVVGQPAGVIMTAAQVVAPQSSWRVLVASKGHDHRAGSILERQLHGLPHRSSIPAEVWDIARNDVWLIPGPQTPSQGALPDTLVEIIVSLFSFVDDLVLNPLAGTDTVARVARRMGRRARCYEPDTGVLGRIGDDLAEHGAGGPWPR